MQIIEQYEDIRRGISYEKFFDAVKTNEKATRSFQEQIRFTLTSDIQTITISPNGEYLVAGTVDGKIAMWNLPERNTKPKFVAALDVAEICTIQFLTDKTLVVGGRSSDVSIIELQNDKIMQRTLRRQHIRTVNASAKVDENTFLTCGYDKTVRIFDKRLEYNNSVSISLPYEQNPVNRISPYVNLRPLKFGGGKDGFVPTIQDESLILDVRKYKDGECYSMTNLPGAAYNYAVGTGMTEARVFDLRAPIYPYEDLFGFSPIFNYQAHCPAVSIAFDDYCEVFAISLKCGKIHAYSTTDLSLLPITLQGVPGRVRGPAANVDPEDFINPYDGTLNQAQITNYLTNNPIVFPAQLYQFEDIPRPVTEYSVHMNERSYLSNVLFFGKSIITGSDSGSIIVYDPDSAEVTSILHPSDDPITCISSAPNIFGIAAASKNNVYYYEITQPCEVDVEESKLHVQNQVNDEVSRQETNLLDLLNRILSFQAARA